MTAVILWIVGSFSGWAATGIAQMALALSFLVVILATADWAFHEGSQHPIRRAVMLGLWVVLAVTTTSARGQWGICLTVAALQSAATIFLVPWRRPRSLGVIEWWEPILSRPERLLATTFLILCIVGGALLLLPAIARILQENVYSLEACEAMLGELAKSHGTTASDAARKRFGDALDRAESNVTEPEEVPVIKRIRTGAAPALDGDPDATDAVVNSIGELIHINREAMRAVDREAQRLGRGGAWAAVFMGFLSFVLSFVVLRYIKVRVVTPIEQVHAVLEASSRGDIHRRCYDQKAPAEIRAVMRSVNSLLDGKMGKGVE